MFKSEEFALPSGEVVQLHGLSAWEVMQSSKDHGEDTMGMTAYWIGCALDTDGEAWMRSHLAGDARALMERIQDLSGLSEGAAKSQVPELRD